MADKRCENGHFIDEAWDICPYCPPPRANDERLVVAAPRPKRPSAADRPIVASVERSAPRHAEPRTPEPIPVHRTVAVPKANLAVSTENRFVVGWLVGINGLSRGESYAIRTGRNIIGRAPKSDIVVTDEQASAHHADLIYRPDERRFILMDHNSTNGTYVNEVEITPRRDLAPRDVVRIGKQKFLFFPLCDDAFSWEEQDYGR